MLQPGEKVAWQGQPDAFESGKIAVPEALFGMLFLGFAVIWVTISYNLEGIVMTLPGLPFAAVGLWKMLGPVRNYLRAGHTDYVITNRQVIILSDRGEYTVVIITADQFSEYERTDRAPGFGNIKLRYTIHWSRKGPSATIEFADGLWGIRGIEGAAAAIATLRAAHHETKEPPQHGK
ncbi:MAG: hypothetical protein AAF441_06590 [Pseudomonadota bacterium]